MLDWCKSIAESITQIPIVLLDGIKDIFIPDTEEINTMFEEVKNSIGNVIGLENFDFNSIWGTAEAPTDIESKVDFGLFSYSGKFVDYSFFKIGIDYFRPYIRGFVILLLCLFNIRQAFSMFSLSSGDTTEGGTDK